MTKKEILKKYIPTNEAGECLGDKDWNPLVREDYALKAMDEYAKQHCIEMLNWMFAGAAETIPYPAKNMWLRDLSTEYKDSAALYDAFLTDQSK